jgi:DUF177 domain-containing protein
MLLDVSRLRASVDRLERRYEPAALTRPDDAFRLGGPVDLAADIRKDAQKIRLTGRVTGALELDCSRCLEPFAVPVDSAFDLLFLPAAENAGTGEREVAEEDLGVSYYRDDVIDLGEIMREQFYLALPMKPLCRTDCLGLCPVCGRNRNLETCSCRTDWEDPRLEPLRRLRKQL